MNFISENDLYEDDLLERDIFDFIDNLENFQSRHKKKKEFLDEKPHRKDLLIFNNKKLVMIAYRRNNKELPLKYRQFYFDLLRRGSKAMLIDEITNFDKTKIHTYLKSCKL